MSKASYYHLTIEIYNTSQSQREREEGINKIFLDVYKKSDLYKIRTMNVMPLDLDLTVTPQIRQKHQKGALLQIIYQKGTLLQLFIWGVCFFITKRTPDRRLHYACDTWYQRGARGSPRIW